MRSIAGKLNSRATAPSPSAELITTSRTELFKPSQCNGADGRICSREFRFHTACMSLLPMVPSSARCSIPNLTGLNGSIRPGPQGGPTIRPGQVLPLFQQAPAHEGDEDESIGQAVEPRQLDLGRHCRNQVIGGETVVGRTTREETQIALDVDGIGGGADVKLRLGIRSQPRAHRVTDCAIDRHALDPDLRPRETYGRGAGGRSE